MKGNNSVRRFALAVFAISLAVAAGSSTAYGEWTGAFYGGKAYIRDSDLEMEQPSLGTSLKLRDVAWDDQSFEGPIYYGVRVGRFFTSYPHFGLEAEFIHLKAVSEGERLVGASGTLRGSPLDRELPMEEIVEHFEITHGMNFILFNVVGRYGFLRDQTYPVGRVRLLARAGVGPTIPHPEGTIGGESFSRYQTNGPGFGAGIGCEVSFSRHFFGLVEYKRTYVDVEVDIPQGTASTALHSNQFIFGLGVSF